MRSRYESSEDEFSYREEEILASSLSSPSLRSYAVKNKSKSKSKSSVGGDDPHSNFLEAEDGEPLPRLPTPILHDHDDSEDPLPPPPPQHEEAIHWILERVLQDVLEYIQPYLEDHVNTVQTDLDRYCREIQETQADQTRALSEQIERIQKIKRDIDGLQYQNTHHNQAEELLVQALEDQARGMVGLNQRQEAHEQDRQLCAQAFQYLENMRILLGSAHHELEQASMAFRSAARPDPGYRSWQFLILSSVLFNLTAYVLWHLCVWATC